MHWNWEWVALGYWFALPATCALAVGLAASAKRAFAALGPGRAAWSLVLAVELAMGLAMLTLTIDLPYFGQAKAASLSTRGGQRLSGTKRHPTLEDEVTVYSSTTILGGETVIGKGAIIGANAFITKSVAPGTRVSIKTPDLDYKSVRSD
jgi:hypothetical protein